MIIETERLILRPFTEDDAEDVYEYLKEPAVNCFACMKLSSVDEAKEEMKKRISETEYYLRTQRINVMDEKAIGLEQHMESVNLQFCKVGERLLGENRQTLS